jgi:hypothetical protein
MKLINLTPHTVRVLNPDNSLAMELPASGQVARVSVTDTPVSSHLDVPVYVQVTGDVTGLPPVGGQTVYVVSAMVRTACSDRFDLFSPGLLVRDEAGQPTGCVGLVCNGGAL